VAEIVLCEWGGPTAHRAVRKEGEVGFAGCVNITPSSLISVFSRIEDVHVQQRCVGQPSNESRWSGPPTHQKAHFSYAKEESTLTQTGKLGDQNGVALAAVSLGQMRIGVRFQEREGSRLRRGSETF
jgi:hypothetical protein